MIKKLILILALVGVLCMAALPANATPAYTADQILQQVRATQGVAPTTYGLIFMGWDGTLARKFKTDSSGELQIDVLTMPAVTVTGVATEATLAALSAKVTACNTGAVVVSSSALPAGAATEATLSAMNAKVTACNTGAVVVSTSALPAGAATEATLSSLNGKVTACNTGAVVVASGGITETNSGTIAGDTTSIDTKITACNTGAVVVASGAITETNSAASNASLTSIDGKITACNTGAVTVSAMPSVTINALPNSNNIIGRTGGGDSVTIDSAVASAGNFLVAGTGTKKHRIFKIWLLAGASTTVTLSDSCGVYKTDANGILELDFNPVGVLQGTADTAITCTTGDASAFYATVIYKDE